MGINAGYELLSGRNGLNGVIFHDGRLFAAAVDMDAENIAGNQTVDGAFYAWMNSESHMKNITNGDFCMTGIGIYTSPVYGKIIVQLFIR